MNSKGDNSILGTEPFKNFSFRFYTKEEIPLVTEHACQYLFSSMDILGYEDYMLSDWKEIFISLLTNTLGHSFIAVDNTNGKIAGMRVIKLTKKGSEKPKPFPFKFEQNRKISNFFDDVGNRCDIFELYPDVTEYPDFFGISVASEYRGQGLATEIYRRCFAMLKAQGFKVVRCSFHVPYSRAAATKLGYKQLVKQMISEIRNKEDGTLMFPNAGPNDFLDYGVFVL